MTPSSWLHHQSGAAPHPLAQALLVLLLLLGTPLPGKSHALIVPVSYTA